jgi:hypothetical protein
MCIACANYRRMTFKKVDEDLKRLLTCPHGKPDLYIAVCGGNVSANLRDRAKALYSQHQIHDSEVWSGVDFEERLRRDAESLLKRFLGGEIFPDVPTELREFVSSTTPLSDEEILALMAGFFDRPAFYTPFRGESSIPAFKKAVTDTIEALNTGIQRDKNRARTH